MEELLTKIERIRRAGKAMLKAGGNSPLCIYNGNVFPVLAVGGPPRRCCITLCVHRRSITVRLDEVV